MASNNVAIATLVRLLSFVNSDLTGQMLLDLRVTHVRSNSTVFHR